MSKNQLKIIGFAGRKRSGKTTLAKYLKNEENAVIITIADFLKYLCCELMNMSYEELNEKKDNGYVFDIVPIGGDVITPQLIVTAAIVTYASKACMNLAKVLGVEDIINKE